MDIETLTTLILVIGIALLILGIILFCFVLRFVITVPRHLGAIADALNDMADK